MTSSDGPSPSLATPCANVGPLFFVNDPEQTLGESNYSITSSASRQVVALLTATFALVIIVTTSLAVGSKQDKPPLHGDTRAERNKVSQEFTLVPSSLAGMYYPLCRCLT